MIIIMNNSKKATISFIQKEFSFKVEELFKTQIPDNFENNHRPSSVFLEKALMISFDKKYESILGQVFLTVYCLRQ